MDLIRFIRATRRSPRREESDLDARTYIIDAQDEQGGWLCDTLTVWPDRHVTYNGRRISRRKAAIALSYYRMGIANAHRYGWAEPWQITRYPRGTAGWVDDNFTTE
jgi:hypothetical protein